MKTIYLITCANDYEKERYAFAELETAETYMRDCIVKAFDENDTDVDNDGYSKEECLDNWHMECGEYYAQLEQITLFE